MIEELTKSEKIHLSTTEISKRVKAQLKEEFPACKFSVTSEYYSGGSSLTVALMVADRRIKKSFDKISERALCLYCERDHARYTVDQLRHIQEENYHQLSSNGFYHYQEYDANHWCNGVFLTYQGYMLLKRVYQITAQYNFDDSDSMTDYYSVNFSLNMALGKWNKAFIDGDQWIDDKTLFEHVNTRDEEVRLWYEQEKENKRLKEIEEAQYRKLHRPTVPSGATHIIDGSGFRALTQEERELGYTKDELKKRWFK